MVPWNAARFYGGYLVGLVIGLVSPITDLVKGVVGLVKLGLSGLEWLAKWSPLGIAVSPERQRKIAELNVRLNALMGELGGALARFVTDPKGTVQKFSGLLDNLMQMAQSKARDMGASGAHAIFDLLGKDFYEMGKGIGEVVGTLVAQVLMLVFSEAIGNLIAKGASLVGKAAEFVAGKAVQAFGWIKGVFVEAGALLRKAVDGALKFFKGVVDKAIEAFDALVAVFSEAAAGEQAAAGVGKGVGGTVSTNMESRMVSGARTTPTTVADLRTPKVHPSNAVTPAATPPEAPRLPGSPAAAGKSMKAASAIEYPSFATEDQIARMERAIAVLERSQGSAKGAELSRYLMSQKNAAELESVIQGFEAQSAKTAEVLGDAAEAGRTVTKKAPDGYSPGIKARTAEMSDAELLASRLEKTLGPRPPGHEAHHMIPKGMKEAEEAREILARAEVGINDAENGIWLPKDSSIANVSTTEIHSKVHTSRAMRLITAELREAEQAGGASGVRRALEAIRTRLGEGVYAR
ncbi:AHH domain-containing protein [Roseateles chitinivorans]|uniref:AHH domain-containing protein n=1 Tax=Roseateles chitinivorans TaxID=2917965 RepID=UPI003D66FD50